MADRPTNRSKEPLASLFKTEADFTRAADMIEAEIAIVALQASGHIEIDGPEHVDDDEFDGTRGWYWPI